MSEYVLTKGDGRVCTRFIGASHAPAVVGAPRGMKNNHRVITFLPLFIKSYNPVLVYRSIGLAYFLKLCNS